MFDNRDGFWTRYSEFAFKAFALLGIAAVFVLGGVFFLGVISLFFK